MTISLDHILHVESLILDAVKHPEKKQDKNTQEAVFQTIQWLEKGLVRVASPKDTPAHCGDAPMSHNLNEWVVHEWVKQSILLAMQIRTSQSYTSQWLPLQTSSPSHGRQHSGLLAYHDKFDVQHNLGEHNVRQVCGSLVREGAYIAPSVILMPSFVNIGAWVSSGTMVDTWATVGSCAQIGKHVHLAGGVGVGGVLEPANARPVLIGDHAFLGSRVIVVEGVIVHTGAILGANVCLTASTPIYDMTTTDKKEYRGEVPPYAVVVPGTRVKSFPAGDVHLQCAYIIAYRNEKTDSKVSLNAVLRETGIALS